MRMSSFDGQVNDGIPKVCLRSTNQTEIQRFQIAIPPHPYLARDLKNMSGRAENVSSIRARFSSPGRQARLEIFDPNTAVTRVDAIPKLQKVALLLQYLDLKMLPLSNNSRS